MDIVKRTNIKSTLTGWLALFETSRKGTKATRSRPGYFSTPPLPLPAEGIEVPSHIPTTTAISSYKHSHLRQLVSQTISRSHKHIICGSSLRLPFLHQSHHTLAHSRPHPPTISLPSFLSDATISSRIAHVHSCLCGVSKSYKTYE